MGVSRKSEAIVTILDVSHWLTLASNLVFQKAPAAIASERVFHASTPLPLKSEDAKSIVIVWTLLTFQCATLSPLVCAEWNVAYKDVTVLGMTIPAAFVPAKV